MEEKEKKEEKEMEEELNINKQRMFPCGEFKVDLCHYYLTQ